MSSVASDKPEEDRAIAQLAEPRRAPGLMQFSLATLLLVTTLIGVCLGIAVAAPTVGAPLIVVIVLAVIRTIAECRRMLCDGKSLDLREKLHAFLRSICVTLLALVCTGLTLVVVSAIASAIALAIASAVIPIVEVFGGKAVHTYAGGFVGLISAIAGLASAIAVFRWLYWTAAFSEPKHVSRG